MAVTRSCGDRRVHSASEGLACCGGIGNHLAMDRRRGEVARRGSGRGQYEGLQKRKSIKSSTAHANYVSDTATMTLPRAAGVYWRLFSSHHSPAFTQHSC